MPFAFAVIDDHGSDKVIRCRIFLCESLFTIFYFNRTVSSSEESGVVSWKDPYMRGLGCLVPGLREDHHSALLGPVDALHKGGGNLEKPRLGWVLPLRSLLLEELVESADGAAEPRTWLEPAFEKPLLDSCLVEAGLRIDRLSSVRLAVDNARVHVIKIMNRDR